MGSLLARRRSWLLSGVLLVFAGTVALGRDCNGNGVEDDDDLRGGFSDDCDDSGIPDECEGIPFQMAATGPSIGVPRTARIVRTGDFDGDGDADLAIGSRDSSSGSKVSVLLNQGDGQFAAPRGFAAGDDLYSLVVDDLDGDGALDVVSANQDHILVLRGSGDGSLAEPAVYAVPRSTRVLATADVNGDGAPDVLACDRNETTISVYLNAGDGSLAEPTAFTAGDDPNEIIAVDLDLDGDLDAVTTNDDSRDVAVLLNDGSGTFAAPIHHALGDRPLSLQSAEFNGDGVPDLVARSSSAIIVLLSTGDGGFAAPVSHGSIGRGLSVGDFDGDGDLDIASGLRSSVQVNLNDGRGGFGVTAAFATLSSVTFVDADDVDGDGRTDLAIVSSTGSSVELLLNGRGAGLAVSTELISPLVGCQDPTRGCRPHSGTVADLDGDGDIDVIGCNTHPGSFAVLLNDGAGGMEIQRAHTFGANNAAGGEHPQSVATSDLDGDGDLDAATVDNRAHDLWIHLNRGDATFERARRYPIGNAPINIQLADLDGDGDDDMVSSNEGGGSITVLFNQGDATFERQGVSDIRTGGSSPRAATVGDWDGDGDLDIAVANGSSANVAVFLNATGGGAEYDRALYRTSGSPNHIVSGDVNGDGHLDLLTAQNSSRCAVLLNSGDGTGTFAEPIESPIGRLAYSLNVLDFDGDGLLDVATGNETTSSVSLLLGKGDGTFKPPTHIDAGTGTQLRFAIPADFDGDGDTDLVTTNREGRSFTMIFNQSALDAPDYASRLCTLKVFHELAAVADEAAGAERFVKYTLPASGEAALAEVAFQNTVRYPLHEDFLRRVFPEQFPALDTFTYNNLIVRAGRQYFVGTIAQLRTPDGIGYGFSVFADFGDPAEQLSAGEVKGVYDRLRERFQLAPFAYYPNTRDAVDVARSWENPGFPIHFPSGAIGGAYVPYTISVGYGRVRRLGADDFDAANAVGQISFQDILVLEEAPRDIEGVVGGVVTAEPQGLLSHVAIRTNRRGTPNMYLRDALEAFAPFDGRLVRLEVKEASYSVEAVTEAQAEEFWRNNRPRLSALPVLDPEFSELASLQEIAAMEMAGGDLPNESRFGGKASGLARLQTILDGPWSGYRLAGFSIPVHYYLEFIASNHLESALDPRRAVTYEEYLNELFADPEFQSNSAFRFDVLENLRTHMREESQVDPELVQMLAARIRAVYADLGDNHRVRFRSSSNVEDAIEFNGAGLYDSVSVCAADDLDANDDGPSLCDPDESRERGIARGLRRVWSSLWNFRAYEERAFYGIDQRMVAMGILSNKTFVGELVNGVAFTGNPTNPADRRYVVTAQKGEESVVSPEPGVRAEQNILEVGEDGQVTRIIRAVKSTLVPDGTLVLSDGQLRELGALMAHIDRDYPVDTGDHAREDVLLDLEFKVDADGTLAVKQVRPFLLTNPEPEAPTFRLEIPAGTVACGLFNLARTPRREYELKSRLRLTPGSFELPTAAESFATPIVDGITVGGAERDVAVAAGPGLFRVDRSVSGDGVINYFIEYEQDFTLSGDVPAKLRMAIASTDDRAAYFQTRDGVPVESRLVLDAVALTDVVRMELEVSWLDGVEDIVYTSCGHEHLPLWHLTTEFEDGTRLRLEERYRPDLTRSVGPASLQAAQVVIGGRARMVTDYWDLVYSATRHNTHEVYWILLDPPATIPTVEKPVHAIELRARIFADNTPEMAYYLGENFEMLARAETLSYEKAPVDETPKPFLRGDVDADGRINLTDAVSLLDYLFLEGGAPPCRKAADALDDGLVNISDAVGVLTFLFGGRPSLPDPFNLCGEDPTPDDLECASYAACE